MPAYFTAKQERQYEHIKRSCVKRLRCKTRGGAGKKDSCRKHCKRIAAATVNAQRGRGMGNLSGRRGPRGRCCVVKGKRKIACFTQKQYAVDFKNAVHRTKGARVFCFRR